MDLASNQTVTGNKTFTGTIGVNHLYESIGNLGSYSGSRPEISMDYYLQGNSLLVASNNNITGNMIFSISNIPYGGTGTTVPSHVSYSFTLILRGNPTVFCNMVNIRTLDPQGGSVSTNSITPISSGGLTNVTIASGATTTVQQFNVIFLGSSTPVVFTNLLSMF
jgi:hypothetical protein